VASGGLPTAFTTPDPRKLERDALTGVEERWTWNDVERSKYSAHVRECIMNRAGSSPEYQCSARGRQEISFEYPHLLPGRSCISCLGLPRSWGRYNPDYLVHPAAIYPVVGNGVVKAWWPTPWTRSNPFLQVRELMEQVRNAVGTGG
jgi:hypothetical protein